MSGNISGESSALETIEDSRLKGFWNEGDAFDLEVSLQVTLGVKNYLVAAEDATLFEWFHGITTKNSSNHGVKYAELIVIQTEELEEWLKPFVKTQRIMPEPY